ncbi:MAG: [acyl-carrier-protein] S-malonyltransferase, partial [Psychrobacter glaciei]
NGVENLVEVGPGKVLTGLNKRIAKNLNNVSVNSVASIVGL